MTQDTFRGPFEATPATVTLRSRLAEADWPSVATLLDEHWVEIWYALDPTDLADLMSRMPREFLAGMTNARYLVAVAGLPDLLAETSPRPGRGARRSTDATDVLNTHAQTIADLRLAGRPARALEVASRAAPLVGARRGKLVDASGGRIALWDVQVGITALLAGDLRAATAALLSATRAHRPERYPFVRREAEAKLALTLALEGDVVGAREWAERARLTPRSHSWVEPLVDDSLWLADYVIAVDSLDLDAAEQMRRARPSPLDHLEFWGVALLVHVRHLALTGRHVQAQALCDAVAALGLPLPESDGWLARTVDDARLHAAEQGEAPGGPPGSPEAVLASRLAAFLAGRFDAVVAPVDAAVEGDATAGRVRVALRLLRAQALHASEPSDETREALACAVEEVRGRGLLSVLRYVDSSTLDVLAGTDAGAVLHDLVERHALEPLHVRPGLESPLSRAEVQVLQHLADGLTRQEIADRLVVSLSTVKSQLRSAYRKLGVSTRTEAMAKAESLGLRSA